MFNLVYDNHRITFGDANVGYKLPYAFITYSTVDHGTVSGVATAQIGSTVTVTATPSSGYTLSYITVNGTQIVGDSFVVTGNTVVGAVFVEAIYCQGDATLAPWPGYTVNEPTLWTEISSLPSSIAISDINKPLGYKTSLVNDTSNLSSISLSNGCGLWIGDNCYNGTTAPSLNFGRSTRLHVGNNSLNGSSTETSASVALAGQLFEFGTNSCTNWNLTVAGPAKIKVNTGCLRTINLANSDVRIIFSGRPGITDGSIVPIILDNYIAHCEFDGLTYGMVLRPPTTDPMRLIRYAGTGACEIWCYNMNSSVISWLNSAKPYIIDGNPTRITFVKKD